jgi:hypothetical protein
MNKKDFRKTLFLMLTLLFLCGFCNFVYAEIIPSKDPMRFEGIVSIDGVTNSSGATILVYVNSSLSKTATVNDLTRYIITAEGKTGQTVTFKINGIAVNEVSETFSAYTVKNKNLSMTRSGANEICTFGYDWSDNGCEADLICCSSNTCKSSCSSGSGSDRPRSSSSSYSTNESSSCSYDVNYDWDCSAWSECINETQIRNCKKTNNCGTTYGRPVVEMTCQINLVPEIASSSGIDINSKIPLFDIIADVVTEPRDPNDNLSVKISLINFETLNITNANINYTITDSNGNIVKQYSRIIPVATQAELLEQVELTGLANGKYTLHLELTYTGQKDPASAEKVFYIGPTMSRNIFGTSIFRIFALVVVIVIAGIYLIEVKKSKKTI